MNKYNYGKEALVLAQEVSNRLRQEQELDGETISFYKYSLNVGTQQTIELPSFMGQAGSQAKLQITYNVPSGVTGEVEVLLNQKPIVSTFLNGIVVTDFIISGTNALAFNLHLSQNTSIFNIHLTVTGKIRKPAIQRDIMVIDNFGCNIYQPVKGASYEYTFSSLAEMISARQNLTSTKVVNGFMDYCYKYQNNTKTGRVELVADGGIKICDGNNVVASLITQADTACISPVFTDGKRFVVYYAKDGKCYYAKMAESFENSEEIEFLSRYKIKKLISVKNVETNGQYLPHFCFIDGNNDAYFVLCSSLGSYSYPQRLGKAENVCAYIKNNQITIFLLYQQCVTKLSGEICSLDGQNSFVVGSREKTNNVDGAGVSHQGKIYYKMRNCVYEFSNG